MKKIPPVLSVLFFAALMWPLKAYVMSSDNYRIDFDSINVGGGYSDSTSYKSESTVGEIATGGSNSDTYNLKAGYLQMNEVYISISVADSVEMTPAIMAISGGTANGTGVITVKTDDPAGYQLKLSASTDPAMASGSANFTDYSGVDYGWSLGSDDSRFGFTVGGVDAASSYKNNGSLCGAGSADGTHCWNGFSGSAPVAAAQSTSANHPDGTESTIYYRAQVDSNGFQTPGNYSATIAATATAN
jgi:hypothetical protein